MDALGWFRAAIEGAVMILELSSALVIVVGGALAAATLTRKLDWKGARDKFSQTLLFALDFTIGADVLKVAVAPDLPTVTVVGIVVAVRIALTVALVWELSRRTGETLSSPVPSSAPE